MYYLLIFEPCKQIASAPPTCPADIDSDCGSGDWDGEFFPGIPKIKYEVSMEMFMSFIDDL